MRKVYFESYDGKRIPYLYFESKEDNFKNQKNIIIFHGMVEPVDRYIDFGNFLSNNGFNVYVMEIRGHGELRGQFYGDFGKKGIKGIFKDIDIFLRKLTEKKDINKENTIIFGHSMGSLIALKLIIKNGYKNLILSGCPLRNKILAYGGYFLTNFERILVVPKKSYFNRQFLKYKKYFGKKFINDSWITRDVEEAKKFLENENCGYPVTPRFFNGIFQMMISVNKSYKKIPEDINILNIYGSDDKVVDIKYINGFMDKLRKKDRIIKNIENKDGRHESLREINKEEIYSEILKWIKNL